MGFGCHVPCIRPASLPRHPLVPQLQLVIDFTSGRTRLFPLSQTMGCQLSPLSFIRTLQEGVLQPYVERHSGPTEGGKDRPQRLEAASRGPSQITDFIPADRIVRARQDGCESQSGRSDNPAPDDRSRSRPRRRRPRLPPLPVLFSSPCGLFLLSTTSRESPGGSTMADLQIVTTALVSALRFQPQAVIVQHSSRGEPRMRTVH